MFLHVMVPELAQRMLQGIAKVSEYAQDTLHVLAKVSEPIQGALLVIAKPPERVQGRLQQYAMSVEPNQRGLQKYVKVSEYAQDTLHVFTMVSEPIQGALLVIAKPPERIQGRLQPRYSNSLIWVKYEPKWVDALYRICKENLIICKQFLADFGYCTNPISARKLPTPDPIASITTMPELITTSTAVTRLK